MGLVHASPLPPPQPILWLPGLLSGTFCGVWGVSVVLCSAKEQVCAAPGPLGWGGGVECPQGSLSSETRSHSTQSEQGWAQAPSWRCEVAGALSWLSDPGGGVLATTCCQPHREFTQERGKRADRVGVGSSSQTPKLDKSVSPPSHSPTPPVFPCPCRTSRGPWKAGLEGGGAEVSSKGARFSLP